MKTLLSKIYRNLYFSFISPSIIFFRSKITCLNYSYSKFPKPLNNTYSKIVLVGTGPSLLKKDIRELKKQGFSILGVNGILKFLDRSEWYLIDYYVVQDIQVYENL